MAVVYTPNVIAEYRLLLSNTEVRCAMYRILIKMLFIEQNLRIKSNYQ